MPTYLVDCGPRADLRELGRRVVQYLGPDATLGRAEDSTYGAFAPRSGGADVFIGLHATGAAGTATWVHSRGGQRSRALADGVLAAVGRYGSRISARVGDVAALSPERHAPGAAACVIEVDDRMGVARDAIGVDVLARAIAQAAHGVQYGKRAAPARAFTDESEVSPDHPMARPFQDLVTRARSDGAYRDRAMDDPIGCLRELGVEVPSELHEPMSQHLRTAIAGQVAGAQSWSRGLEAPTADVYARPWGVVIALNSQATSDLANGANAVAGVAAIVTAACGATSNVPCAAVAGIISGYLWAMASVISLMNRGNGVYLTIPWTSLLPAMPKVVIPTPR